MDAELDDGPVIEYFKKLAPHLAQDSQMVAVFFAVGDGSFVDEVSGGARPEFLASLDMCFDVPNVGRCRELNRKGFELAGCISPETAYPFQKRYLPIINEGYRRFNAFQKDLDSRGRTASNDGGRNSGPPEFQRFGEKDGERGLRVSSKQLEGTLGDGFGVGIRQEGMERFCAALEVMKLQPPSPSMAEMAEQLIAELTAPGVAVIAGMRMVVVNRTVDHSGSLPKVTGCDETRVLTILAAVATSQPSMLETYIEMLRGSGIQVKAKPLTKGTIRFEVFDESLDVGIGPAN